MDGCRLWIIKFYSRDLIHTFIHSAINSAISSFSPDSATFAVMEDGTIILVGMLDYEAVTTYNLTVEASDNGIPMLASSIVVTIEVVDDNDNPPIFVVDFGSQGIDLSEVRITF